MCLSGYILMGVRRFNLRTAAFCIPTVDDGTFPALLALTASTLFPVSIAKAQHSVPSRRTPFFALCLLMLMALNSRNESWCCSCYWPAREYCKSEMRSGTIPPEDCAALGHHRLRHRSSSNGSNVCNPKSLRAFLPHYLFASHTNYLIMTIDIIIYRLKVNGSSSLTENKSTPYRNRMFIVRTTRRYWMFVARFSRLSLLARSARGRQIEEKVSDENALIVFRSDESWELNEFMYSIKSWRKALVARFFPRPAHFFGFSLAWNFHLRDEKTVHMLHQRV